MHINKLNKIFSLSRKIISIISLLLFSQIGFAAKTPLSTTTTSNKIDLKNIKNLEVSTADKTQGFYVGLGTGYASVSNSNLIKVYKDSLEYKNLGDKTGNSNPVSFDIGYRFNQYVSTEITYNYSSDQRYYDKGISGGFLFGSQNSYTLSALGYLPIIEHFYLKGRVGIAYSRNTLTNYPGSTITGSFTSVLVAGAQYFIGKNVSLDFDYVNYGALAPMELKYHPPVGAKNPPNLGTIDTITSNQFLLSINYHF